MRFATLHTASGGAVCINLEQIVRIEPCAPQNGEINVAVTSTDGCSRVIYVGEYDEIMGNKWRVYALDLFWLQVEGAIVQEIGQ